MKSLDTLGTISSYLSPARVVDAAEKEYKGKKALFTGLCDLTFSIYLFAMFLRMSVMF